MIKALIGSGRLPRNLNELESRRNRQSQLPGDAANAMPLFDQSEDRRLVSRESFFPPKFHTLRFGSPQPRGNPLLDYASLELRNGHKNVQLQLAGRITCRCVNPLAWADQSNTVSRQL